MRMYAISSRLSAYDSSQTRLNEGSTEMTVFIATILIAAVLFALWKIPEWQVRAAKKTYGARQLSAADLLKAENDRRSTLAQVFGGLAILIGLYFTGQTLRLQQEGQITDRINKAVEQLGS